jgi:hypothetical protein
MLCKFQCYAEAHLNKKYGEKSASFLVRSRFCNIFLNFLRYLMYFSGLHNPFQSQKNSVCRWLWTVKNVFFGIPGNLETLIRKLRYGRKCEVMPIFFINFKHRSAQEI